MIQVGKPVFIASAFTTPEQAARVMFSKVSMEPRK